MTITIANNNINSSGTLTLNSKALSDVAFSGDYNDLINAPSIESGQLVSKWDDGAGGWYRKYSDDWIEQGGYSISNTTNRSVTFPVQMAKPLGVSFADVRHDTGYYPNYIQRVPSSGFDISNVNLTSTGFQCFNDHNSGIFWRAFGYQK